MAQFLIYIIVGGISATVNLAAFLVLLAGGLNLTLSAIAAFVSAAAVNYFLCTGLVFRQRVRRSLHLDVILYVSVVVASGTFDLEMTKMFLALRGAPWFAKSMASITGLMFNFLLRKYLVFPHSDPESASSLGLGVTSTND